MVLIKWSIMSILIHYKPWAEAIIWVTSGTVAAVFNKSLSLFHRKRSPDTRSPHSHIPGKQQQLQSSLIILHCFDLTVDSIVSPFWDEAIVTTLLSKCWSLGVFFLVRPDAMLISLIRLSSNKNKDSFSWGITAEWNCSLKDSGLVGEVFVYFYLFNIWHLSPDQASRIAAMVSFVWYLMTK